MAYPNGRIPKTALEALPRSWSNKGAAEYLARSAYASLTRMLARAVADTGVNFQIYDAYRSLEEQEKFHYARYERAKPGKYYRDYNTYKGFRYGLVSGAKAATPGTSNHGTGISIDIHPEAIQRWLRSNASRFGWVAEVSSEPWHWSYLNPRSDRYKSEGLLDHAWVQRVVGASVDGKIGTATVEKIKAYQRSKGLTADGIVGAKTKARMLKGVSAPATTRVETLPKPKSAEGFTYTYSREMWDGRDVSEKVHAFDHTVKGAYIHWPGSSGKFGDSSPEDIAKTLQGYRRQHVDGNGWFDIAYSAAVDQSGRTYELRGLGNETGANGGEDSNNEAIAILLLVGTDESPTSKMLSALSDLLNQAKTRYPSMEYIRGHRQSPDASTTCPGPIVQKMIDDKKISFTSKGRSASTASSPKPPASKPLSKIPSVKKLSVDGSFGPDTIDAFMVFLNSRGAKLARDKKAGHEFWKALQRYLGTPVDGEVSSQARKADEVGPRGAITQGWDYDGSRARGSRMVRALQKWVGVKVDGIVGPDTVKGVQKKLNKHAVGM